MKRVFTQFGLLVAGLLLVGAGCFGAQETVNVNTVDVDLSESAVFEFSTQAGGLDAASAVLEDMLDIPDADDTESTDEDSEDGEANAEAADTDETQNTTQTNAQQTTEEQQVVEATSVVDTQTSATGNASADAEVESEETNQVEEASEATTTETTQESAEETEQTEQAEEEAVEVVEEEQKKISVSIGVVSPTGSRSDYTVKIDEGGTVEDAMQKAKNKGLSYGTRQFGGMGTYVESVNGTEESGGLYWVFYVNNVRAISGISTYKLDEGDEVLWKFRAPGAPD